MIDAFTIKLPMVVYGCFCVLAFVFIDMLAQCVYIFLVSEISKNRCAHSTLVNERMGASFPCRLQVLMACIILLAANPGVSVFEEDGM